MFVVSGSLFPILICGMFLEVHFYFLLLIGIILERIFQRQSNVNSSSDDGSPSFTSRNEFILDYTFPVPPNGQKNFVRVKSRLRDSSIPLEINCVFNAVDLDNVQRHWWLQSSSFESKLPPLNLLSQDLGRSLILP